MAQTSLRRLDLTERFVVLVVYVTSATVLLPEFVANPTLGTSLVLTANIVVVGFVVSRRRPQEV
jgi:hypothetical protein